MTKQSILLVMGVAVGCQVTDPNPVVIPGGGSGGAATAGASAAGSSNGGVAPGTAGAAGNSGAAGSQAGSGGQAVGGTTAAGAGGDGYVAGEGGAAGSNATPEGGAGGEGAGAGGEGGSPGDGCSPACSSTQSCVAGACKDQNCTPNASFCSGSALRTCGDTGLFSVEVTTCEGGKYCDPGSAGCKQGFPSCPNIYFGSGRFGAGQLPASHANDGIVLLNYDVKVNTQIFGQIRVNNLGTDNSPSTHLEVYLSVAPGLAALPNRLIFEQNIIVPGAAQGGTPGEYTTNFSYGFTTVGQYVLLARLENNSPPTGAACVQQGYDVSSPATNAQSAVHYVNVVE